MRLFEVLRSAAPMGPEYPIQSFGVEQDSDVREYFTSLPRTEAGLIPVRTVYATGDTTLFVFRAEIEFNERRQMTSATYEMRAYPLRELVWIRRVYSHSWDTFMNMPTSEALRIILHFSPNSGIEPLEIPTPTDQDRGDYVALCKELVARV